MSDQNDKYAESEGEDPQSQVRSIIRKLNEDAPGKEKSREVIVREDGTKVIRVTKKKRVMLSKRDKRRRSLKAAVVVVLVIVLLALCGGGYFAYRMSTMSGEAYLTDRTAALKEAWGAENLICEGATIKGTEMHIERLVAEFPADSLLKRIELRKIKGQLAAKSFFVGKPCCNDITIGSASVTVNGDIPTLQMPLHQGEELWEVKNVSCGDLNLAVTSAGGKELLALSGVQGYLYYPRKSRSINSVTLRRGTLRMRGWSNLQLVEGTCLISADGIETFDLLTRPEGTSDKEDCTLAFDGSITVGSSLEGPFNVRARRIPLAEFTESRFSSVLTAMVVRPADGGPSGLRVQLPLRSERPVFSGVFPVADITITRMPALSVICEHVQTDRRGDYLPIKISSGRLSVERKDGGYALYIRDGEMTESDKINIRADVFVDGSNALSGTFDYGIPEGLTNREYTDGRPDPVYQQVGSWCWLNTKLSGWANDPDDNASELNASKVAERAERTRIARDEEDRIDAWIRSSLDSSDAKSGKQDSGSGNTPAAPSSSQTPGATQGATPDASPNGASRPSLPAGSGAGEGSSGSSQPWNDPVWGGGDMTSSPASGSTGNLFGI